MRRKGSRRQRASDALAGKRAVDLEVLLQREDLLIRGGFYGRLSPNNPSKSHRTTYHPIWIADGSRVHSGRPAARQDGRNGRALANGRSVTPGGQGFAVPQSAGGDGHPAGAQPGGEVAQARVQGASGLDLARRPVVPVELDLEAEHTRQFRRARDRRGREFGVRDVVVADGAAL